jgi:hypothetical protein
MLLEGAYMHGSVNGESLFFEFIMPITKEVNVLVFGTSTLTRIQEH